MSRAQASMEYVTTYIYAGLALVIVVGAMGYFGAFDTTTYARESCESGSQVSCVDVHITSEGAIGIMLNNNHDRSINITNYTLTFKDKTYRVDGANIIIKPNDNGTLRVDLDQTALNKGHKESFNYVITYVPEGSTRGVQLSGTATTKVEENIEPVCGNGVIEGDEQCDPPGQIPASDYDCADAPQMQTVDQSLYAIKGEVYCTSSCTVSTEGCYAQPLPCTTPSLGPGIEIPAGTNALVQACCEEEQCSIGGVCYDDGRKLDIDGDGIAETCDAGTWLQCVTSNDCGANEICKNSVCVSNPVCAPGSECSVVGETISCGQLVSDTPYMSGTATCVQGNYYMCAYDRSDCCTSEMYSSAGWVGDYQGDCCPFNTISYVDPSTPDMEVRNACCEEATDCVHDGVCYAPGARIMINDASYSCEGSNMWAAITPATSA